MPKINRYTGNVLAFASSYQSGEKYVFGSADTNSDDLSDQLTADYLRGWGTVGASEFPPLEWFNASMYTATQFNSYLHQMGVAEWDSAQEYYENSIANRNGFVCISKTDSNVGNDPLTDKVNWSIQTAENRIKGLQNWNIPDNDTDPLISSTPTDYGVGEFPAKDVEVITASTQLKIVNRVVSSDDNVGVLRIWYRGDNANITTATEYMGIKLDDDSQAEAGVVSGATKGSSGNDLYVDVDLSVITSGFKFGFVCPERGFVYEISDEESLAIEFSDGYAKATEEDVTVSRALGVTYTNTDKYPRTISVTVSSVGSVASDLVAFRNGRRIYRSFITSTTENGLQVTIFPDDTYSITSANLTISEWLER